MRTYDRAPPELDAFTIPGVVREPKKKQSASLDHSHGLDAGRTAGLKGDDEREEPRTESSICNWKPNRYNNEELNYQCANTVLFNPSMRRYENICAYHMPACWMPVSI